jgi:hypothetical protein
MLSARLEGYGGEGGGGGIGETICRDGDNKENEQYKRVNDEGRDESEHREGDEGLR